VILDIRALSAIEDAVIVLGGYRFGIGQSRQQAECEE